ncbi:hypothetical protein [Wenzhouxiangella sediminis]|uniref:Uncharacterized protein n=1 Tax=Wenzhouxiangella sediminis TaxID=1792836 RepID=A0A3E1K9U8_9GAMM|nr:hypothetical protein [Wenzhouxiangella sediminis]RFF31042.1 hypothetical protein DZC52_05850 [Wenzhouxiangella sediminis]
MKADSSQKIPAPSREMGYLIGAIIGFVFAIAIFALTEQVVVAIAASVPIGLTLGIALAEQPIQERPGRRKRLFLSIAVLIGIVAFGSIIVLVR